VIPGSGDIVPLPARFIGGGASDMRGFARLRHHAAMTTRLLLRLALLCIAAWAGVATASPALQVASKRLDS